MSGQILLMIVILLTHSQSAFSGEMDFDAYRMLDLGHSENDVIKRAGRPDRTVIFYGDSGNVSDDTKQLLYIPASGSIDPHFTVVTLQHQKIIKLEREQSSVPPDNAIPGQMPHDIYSSLNVGMSEGELLARAGFPAREYEPKPERHVNGRTILMTEFVYEAALHDIVPQMTYIYIREGKISKIVQGPPGKQP
jgi:hypothetical protein